MKWKQNREITNEYIEELSKELNSNYLITRIVLNRKNDINFARLALKDYFEAIMDAKIITNAEKVAKEIAQAIKDNMTILIHADYDADGLNGGYIFEDSLKCIAEYFNSTSKIKSYFPDRKDGYGLSEWYASKVIEYQKANPNENVLVLTVDNGVAQVNQIQMLLNNNIPVIVTDHHNSKEEIPNCLICDPHNAHEEQNEDTKHLCGTAVAFKVCGLIQEEFGFYDMTKYVPNLAIATITDMMPLTTENIAFIHYGLEIINSDECPIGIKAMKNFIGIKNVTPTDIGWEIGPRLNATGRMGNTYLGARLLFENDYDIATDIVNGIELLNDKRKEITKAAQKQLDKMNFDNDKVCIVPLENIPEGIVGIIAGKATEKFKKVSIVVTEHDGICKGSARSIPGIDLMPLLNKEMNSENIINYGGHSGAAGIQFNSEKLEDLKKSLNKSISKELDSILINNEELDEEEILEIDECLYISEINEYTYSIINKLPYDKNDFKKPVFAITDCKVMDFIPTKTNPDNCWLTLKQESKQIKLWCRDITKKYKALNCPKQIHIAGYLEKNFMMGRPYIINTIDIMDASV